MSLDGVHLYVANSLGANLFILNTADYRAYNTLSIAGVRPQVIVLSDDGNTAYVSALPMPGHLMTGANIKWTLHTPLSATQLYKITNLQEGPTVIPLLSSSNLNMLSLSLSPDNSSLWGQQFCNRYRHINYPFQPLLIQ